MEYDPTPLYRVLAWLSLAALIYLFLFAQAISAQVIISEVYPAPTTGETEWVELYNASSSSASLAGWQLEDQLTTPSLLKQWTTETLPALSFLVVELASAKLNNSADGVTLKDAVGNIVNTMSYANSETGKSWSLIGSESGTESWVLGTTTRGITNPVPSPSPSLSPSPSPLSTPTPSASPQPSPSPSLISYPTTALSLTEIYPCPLTNELEWLKIFNSSPQLVELNGWKLKDSTATIFTFTTETIPAQGSLVTQLPVAKLNNTGDSLTLEAPNGSIAFEENYSNCIKGQSLVKVADEWQEISASSSPNPSPTSIAQESKNILDATTDSVITSPLSTQASSTTQIPKSWPLTEYLPQLGGFSPAEVRQGPPLNLAAPEPDIWGASSAIMGGLLVSASNGFWLLKKLPNVENLP